MVSPSNVDCVVTEPTRLACFRSPNCLDVFEAAELTRAANQIRSHPPMSMTWNRVSERARRIPVRVFKIHERSALAMKFTCVAVIEIVVRGADATQLPRYSTQHVGVARNFEREII